MGDTHERYSFDPSIFTAYTLTLHLLAIEHIQATQHNERHLANELSRLQHDSEYARDAQKENDILKTELQVMHQAMTRMDPNAPHVYGHFTNHLSQTQQQQQPSAPQTNGSAGPGGAGAGVSLPPLNPTNSHGSAHGGPSGPGSAFGAPPAGAMQGVEYGYGSR